MQSPDQFQVVTANDLLSGKVVFMTGNRTWSADIRHAVRFDSQTAAHAVLAQVVAQDPMVVGPYLVDVSATGMPLHFREVFRITGPTNRNLNRQNAAA